MLKAMACFPFPWLLALAPTVNHTSTHTAAARRYLIV